MPAKIDEVNFDNPPGTEGWEIVARFPVDDLERRARDFGRSAARNLAEEHFPDAAHARARWAQARVHGIDE